MRTRRIRKRIKKKSREGSRVAFLVSWFCYRGARELIQQLVEGLSGDSCIRLGEKTGGCGNFQIGRSATGTAISVYPEFRRACALTTTINVTQEAADVPNVLMRSV
jgi:hypothetical protein